MKHFRVYITVEKTDEWGDGETLYEEEILIGEFQRFSDAKTAMDKLEQLYDQDKEGHG